MDRLSANTAFTACAVLLLFAGSRPVAAATADPVTPAGSRANDVVQLATLKHDRKTMDAMIAQDFVLVLTHGDVVDRKGWLDEIADPKTHVEINQTSDLSIHHYNDDCALAIGVLHLRYRVNSHLTDVRMRFIDVWVKQRGRWKWASSQVAHFPDPSAKS